jgi:hypothetical protein
MRCSLQHCCKVQEHVVGAKRFDPALCHPHMRALPGSDAQNCRETPPALYRHSYRHTFRRRTPLRAMFQISVSRAAHRRTAR